MYSKKSEVMSSFQDFWLKFSVHLDPISSMRAKCPTRINPDSL
jgi:hypothetical protein